MANAYTTPVQSQFVPTYQPMNINAINIGAQALQQRQDEAFKLYDEFQETSRKLQDQLFEEDKPLFKSKLKDVQGKLDKLAADGDLSDAKRQIRSLASQFKDQAQTGDLGTAFDNYTKAQEKFKQINDSDLPDAVKERRKNAIIADYQGVKGDGELDLGINTDYIDRNKWVDDRVSNMSPTKIAKETGWTWRPKIGKFQKGNIKVSQVPRQAIRQVIENSIANDPEAQSALRQQAKSATAGQKEFTIQEDGEPKIISRQEMMDRIVEQEKDRMVGIAQTKFGAPDISQSTSVTSAGDGATSQALADGYTTYVTGVSRVAEMGITDMQSGYQQIRDLEVAGDEQASEDMEQTMNLALMNFGQEAEDVDESDIEFMKQTGREIAEINAQEKATSNAGVPVLAGAEGAAGMASQPRAYPTQVIREQLGDEKLKKYQRLQGKFDDWLEKGGGYVQDEITHNIQSQAGNQAFERANDVLQRSNPGNWRQYGRPEADQMMKSKEGLPKGARNRMETFQFKSVVPGNDYNPTMVNGYWLNEDGEEERVSLVYQRSPAASPGAYDPLDQILNGLGSKGQQVLKDRRYDHIKPGTDFKNIKDQLPMRTNNDYVGIKRTPEGYQSMYGSEEEQRPFTEGALIQSLMSYAGGIQGSPRELLDNIDNRGVLTEEEKGFILEGSLQDPEGDEREMAQNIKRKLATQFTDPYTFKNKRVASEIAAQTEL